MKNSAWRGSTLQSIAIIVIPLTLVLVVISLGSFEIHQNIMRNLVGERDKRSTQSAAGAIGSEIHHRLFAIQSLALMVNGSPPGDLQSQLDEFKTLLVDFDHGSALIDIRGTVLAETGDAAFWQSLTSAPGFSEVLQSSSQQMLSTKFNDPTTSDPVVLISARSRDGSRIALGAFSPVKLMSHSLQEIFPLGGDTTIYVIDSNYRVLFHAGPDTLESKPADHPGISAAIHGQSGALYVKSGKDEHVVAYSPISTVDWAIITEESWEKVSNPTLRASQIIPLVLIPALLISMLALWFGARQIVRPLQELESKAAKLAWGDFQEIEKPVGGIAEIRDLQTELAHMAKQLQVAQDSLHSYIGAITLGQEAERLRLARELHDDTIQSLIALKQRVQLVRLPRKKDNLPADLQELETLIEQAIADLRRTTQALRPIYLEDLGMVTALEMLTRETGQNSGIKVEFHCQGDQRRLPSEVELALYRVAQEAINNAVQHANASHIQISLDFGLQLLRMEIKDDGRGFDVPKTPAEFAPKGHFGLLGLFERVELIRAKLDISSSPGLGTSLTITLPINA